MAANLDELFPGLSEQPGGDLAGLSFRNGNPSGPERHALAQVARAVGAETAFEIGTFQGGTARMLARLPDILTVWTLDLPEGAEPALPLAADDWLYLHAVKPDFPAAVAQLWGDSATFDFSEYESRADLVYVDGAHSIEYSANDLAAALKLVTPRGAVVWHAGTGGGVSHLPAGLEFYPLSERMGIVRGTLPERKGRRRKVQHGG